MGMSPIGATIGSGFNPVATAVVGGYMAMALLIDCVYFAADRKGDRAVQIQMTMNMKQSIRFLGIAGLVIALNGCATGPGATSVPSNISIKKAAVISVAARTFTRAYTGLTVFNNESEEIDIADWHVDDGIEQSARDELEKQGVVTVTASYPLDAFSHVNDLNGPYSAPAFWGPNWSHIEQPAKQYCQQNGLDALFVVAKSTTGDFLGRTNQSFGGAGTYARGGFGSMAVVHLVAVMGVIDCSTGKAVATMRVSSMPDGSNMEVLRHIPLSEIPIDDAKTPVNDWSDALRSKFKETLSVTSQSAVKKTVKKLLNKGA